MSLFRSEEMARCQLFIQPESAYSSVSILGEAGVAQFRDLNTDVNSFQKKFVGEVRRCEEMERKLRFIAGELKKDGIGVPRLNIEDMPKAPNPREMIDLENDIEKTSTEISEMSENATNLRSTFTGLTQYKHVLIKTDAFFHEQEGDGGKSLMSEDATSRINLGFVAGVILRERVFSFERMLWRVSRGNVFLRQAEIDELLYDAKTGNTVQKCVFVAFFQGEQLKSRVTKVCAGYHAETFNCPTTKAERQELLKNVDTQLRDLTTVLNQTNDHRQRGLTKVAKEIPAWFVMVKKMKAIYHTMNLFNVDVTKKCLIGECWVPTADLSVVNQSLVDGAAAVGSTSPSFVNVIETKEQPPTYFRTNRFTNGFQVLIDSYGIATYREVNPALYTIITFPFLFAIMFGDAGHGCLLTAFGAFMVIKENKFLRQKSNNEIWNIFFGGRYIILLMGLFSIYTGLIYNDVFSKSVNIFGSSWRSNYNLSTVRDNPTLTLSPSTDDYKDKLPYPFGLDPVWQLAAANKIIFLNSYKMKLSIIIGVIHMIFGVFMSIPNYVHKRKYIYIFVMFLPEVIFLCLLFFYLALLMMLKAFLYAADNPLATSARCAPSVLITFINMMLLTPAKSQFKECEGFEYMYPHQEIVERILLLLAVLCIPVMLIGKPIYLICWVGRKKRNTVAHITTDIELQANGTAKIHEEGEHEEEEEPAGEIIIHQIIHTIEYVLSTVSHTASYLRLWALSLAHAQLSEVLWSMVFRKALAINSYTGAIAVYVIFAVWAVFTIAILVLMEGLSAFLHTLRLHWVEFMSKFYEGGGYAFQPFSFKHVTDDGEEPSE